MDEYDFDVALYGPIARVVNTQKIIMERKQKFESVRVDYLHGIDNTGWEYKSFFDLEQLSEVSLINSCFCTATVSV